MAKFRVWFGEETKELVSQLGIMIRAFVGTVMGKRVSPLYLQPDKITGEYVRQRIAQYLASTRRFEPFVDELPETTDKWVEKKYGKQIEEFMEENKDMIAEIMMTMDESVLHQEPKQVP